MTLTAAQYTADAAVLAKITSAYTLTVTGALASAAAGLQANTHVTGFTISDSSADVAGAIATLNGDTKLTSIALTDSNPFDHLCPVDRRHGRAGQAAEHLHAGRERARRRQRRDRAGQHACRFLHGVRHRGQCHGVADRAEWRYQAVGADRQWNDRGGHAQTDRDRRSRRRSTWAATPPASVRA